MMGQRSPIAFNNGGTPPQSGTKQPTTIGGYVLAVARTLEHYGVEPGSVLRMAGIQTPLANDPLLRVPVTTMTRLFRACVDATQDPYFGLTASRYIHVSNIHALGYALMTSSTLMDYCRRLARYYHFASQVCEVEVEQSGEEISLRWHLNAAVCGETEDAVLAFVVAQMRQLHRPTIDPIRIEIQHAMPAKGDGPYRQLFRAPIVFNARQPMVVMSRRDLEQPLASGCPELAQYHDQVVKTYLARLERNDILLMVQKTIIELLPSGECGRERVAQAMCMSPSTLQAKLLQRQTNFQAILDETRKELACGYVQQVTRPLIEIAFLLGFSDSSNFTRAFKRWTGLSPSEYRLKQTIQASGGPA